MMMLGYARVSTNEQDTAAHVSALNPPVVKRFFLRRLQQLDGTAQSCIAFWTNCGRAMYSLCGVWTDFRDRFAMS